MNELGWALRGAGIVPLVLLLVPFAGGCKEGCGRDARSESAGPGTPDAAHDGAVSASGGPDGGTAAPPSIPDAAAAVNAVRPQLRACFAQQLGRAPSPTGRVTFAIEVGADGKVIAATPQKREGLDDDCIACMVAGVKSATFTPPLDGMPATVIAPLTFHAANANGPRPIGVLPNVRALPSTLVPPEVSARPPTPSSSGAPPR